MEQAFLLNNTNFDGNYRRIPENCIKTGLIRIKNQFIDKYLKSFNTQINSSVKAPKNNDPIYLLAGAM